MAKPKHRRLTKEPRKADNRRERGQIFLRHVSLLEEVAMPNIASRILLRNGVTAVVFAVLASIGVLAQSSGPRTLEELKAETQKRVDRNVAPAGGLKSEDAREALANSHSLDRDEWTAARSAIADRYASRAATEESSDKTKEQQD